MLIAAVVVSGVVLYQVLVQHTQLLLFLLMMFGTRTTSVASGRAVRGALLMQMVHR